MSDLGEEQYADAKDMTGENRMPDNSFEARKRRKELTIEEWLRLPC